MRVPIGAIRALCGRFTALAAAVPPCYNVGGEKTAGYGAWYVAHTTIVRKTRPARAEARSVCKGDCHR
jgi:hypothetical protein